MSNLRHFGIACHVAGDYNYPGPTSTRKAKEIGSADKIREGYYSSEALALQSAMVCFHYRNNEYEFKLKEQHSPWKPVTDYMNTCT